MQHGLRWGERPRLNSRQPCSGKRNTPRIETPHPNESAGGAGGHRLGPSARDFGNPQPKQHTQQEASAAAQQTKSRRRFVLARAEVLVTGCAFQKLLAAPGTGRGWDRGRQSHARRAARHTTHSANYATTAYCTG